MIIALYPGSFDPVTKGHLDIACRAARLFDRLIIGVYDTPEKKLMFSTAERVALFSEATRTLPNVEIRPFSGLLISFARELKVDTVVRGLRVSNDFEFEFDMAMLNRKLAPELELICFMASPEYQFLSASMMKEVAHLGGDITAFVPANVVKAIKSKVAAER